MVPNIDPRWPLGAIATILDLACPDGRGSFTIGGYKCRLDSVVQFGIPRKVLVVRMGSTEKIISFVEMSVNQLQFSEQLIRWRTSP